MNSFIIFFGNEKNVRYFSKKKVSPKKKREDAAIFELTNYRFNASWHTPEQRRTTWRLWRPNRPPGMRHIWSLMEFAPPTGKNTKHKSILEPTFSPVTPLEPQSRFGDKLLEIWLVCPLNGTAVLKGLMPPPLCLKSLFGLKWGAKLQIVFV